MKKVLTIVVTVILIIIVIVGIAGIWVSSHYKPIIADKLPVYVNNATDNKYKLIYASMELNAITGHIAFNNVVIFRDTAKVPLGDTETWYNIQLSKIEANSVNWIGMIKGREYSCGSINIVNPQIKAHVFENHLSPFATKSDTSIKSMNRFSLDRLTILNPSIEAFFINRNGNYECLAKGGSVKLFDFELSEGNKTDSNLFAFSKKGIISVDTFNYLKENSLYTISSSILSFSTEDSKVELNGLALRPIHSYTTFYKKVGHQKEIYDLRFPKLTLEHFDWKKLIHHKTFIVERLVAEKPSLEIYFSRLYAPSRKSKVGNYPNQLLQKLPFPLYVSKLALDEGHFKYTEMNRETHMEGIIRMEHVHGTIENITNIDTVIRRNKNCTVKLSGKYNNRCDLQSTITLRLSDSTGHFTVDGVARNVSATDVSQPARTLALAEVNSLKVSRMDMHIDGDERQAKGHYTMLYNDLKINFLTIQDGILADKSRSLSFIANKLVLYSDNPMKGDDVRTAESDLVRDPYRGFFSLIWKSIYEGARKTVIRTNPANAIEGVKKSKIPLLKRIFKKKK